MVIPEIQSLPIKTMVDIYGEKRSDIFKTKLYKSKKRIEIRVNHTALINSPAFVVTLKTNIAPLYDIAKNLADGKGVASQHLQIVVDKLKLHEEQGTRVFYKA